MNRELLSADLYQDDQDRPVLRLACDCATVTDYVLDINVEAELAFTCDGCYTTRWLKVDPVVKP